ncbi:CPBP family intramembrane metalloprotease [Xanthomonas sp. PPL139]|uniref:CPBP family intramembrane glutamic endopeptidase n=1 Tax=unclassified Xanthomonas TaxID=2643310 RepID=UPI0033AAB7DF
MKNLTGAEPAHQARSIAGVALIIAAYFFINPLASAIYGFIATSLNLTIVSGNTIHLLPFGVVGAVRLILDFFLVVLVYKTLNRKFRGFPLLGPHMLKMAVSGLAIGMAVMSGAILAIIATGNASVSVSPQPFTDTVRNASGWLAFEGLAALGEELLVRVAVLVVAERFAGWRGALIASGLMFAALHLDNPGATGIWLTRLLCQGVLLAYAVYRTGSFWWSVGYHTGWNWASAPIFGASGSGYYVDGHVLTFTPGDAHWITGGAVGPEGSVFAFVAVLAGFLLLVATTPNRRMPPRNSLTTPDAHTA